MDAKEMSEEEGCECFTVRRAFGQWKSVECGREFVPKKRAPRKRDQK